MREIRCAASVTSGVTLCKLEPRAEGAGNFMADNQSADGGRDDQRDGFAVGHFAKTNAKGAAEGFRMDRILEYLCALQILGAVQAAG